MTKKNKGGRPPLYNTPEELQQKALEYFESLIVKKEDGTIDYIASLRPTITGLCLYIGFESRQSFYAYGHKKEFSYTIKKLHLMIENSYEQKLHGAHVAGIIFALKNLGWTDKQEIEHSGELKIPDEQKENRVNRIRQFISNN